MSTDSRPASEAGAQAPTADAALAEPAPEAAPSGAAKPSSNLRRNIVLLIAAVIIFDIAAAIFVPPFPKGQPGEPISGIGDLIMANLEFPAPEIVWQPALPAGEEQHAAPDRRLQRQHLELAVHDVARDGGPADRVRHRGPDAEAPPRPLQNASSSPGRASRTGPSPSAARTPGATSRSSPRSSCSSCSRTGAACCRSSARSRAPARADERRERHDRPGPGRVLLLPLPGLPAPRRPRLPRQVLRLHRLQAGLGAGFIDLFVGLIEFLLEFIKPVTLSMRLFGNIFGGEVALGVITALTIALIPIGDAAARGPAELRPGPHLLDAHADVHDHRGGEPPRRRARGAGVCRRPEGNIGTSHRRRRARPH